ncbi:unnamed protein product [Polarella glacialis]|uniref:HECT domain-containing protein n=1 Tax=Polarella glacialis TaxID=89957 RepID=A0A813HHM3_POLGL|nr:unnamed protein product [Polarella glacialis]
MQQNEHQPRFNLTRAEESAVSNGGGSSGSSGTAGSGMKTQRSTVNLGLRSSVEAEAHALLEVQASRLGDPGLQHLLRFFRNLSHDCAAPGEAARDSNVLQSVRGTPRMEEVRAEGVESDEEQNRDADDAGNDGSEGSECFSGPDDFEANLTAPSAAGALARCGLSFAFGLFDVAHAVSPACAAALLEQPLAALSELPPFALGRNGAGGAFELVDAAVAQLSLLQKRLADCRSSACRALLLLARATGSSAAALEVANVLLSLQGVQRGSTLPGCLAEELTQSLGEFCALGGSWHFERRSAPDTSVNEGQRGTRMRLQSSESASGSLGWVREDEEWQDITARAACGEDDSAAGQGGWNSLTPSAAVFGRVLRRPRHQGRPIELRSFAALRAPAGGVLYEVELLEVPGHQTAAASRAVAAEFFLGLKGCGKDGGCWGFDGAGQASASDSYEGRQPEAKLCKGATLSFLITPTMVLAGLNGEILGHWRLSILQQGAARRIFLRLPAASAVRLRLERNRLRLRSQFLAAAAAVYGPQVCDSASWAELLPASIIQQQGTGKTCNQNGTSVCKNYSAAAVLLQHLVAHAEMAVVISNSSESGRPLAPQASVTDVCDHKLRLGRSDCGRETASSNASGCTVQRIWDLVARLSRGMLAKAAGGGKQLAGFLDGAGLPSGASGDREEQSEHLMLPLLRLLALHGGAKRRLPRQLREELRDGLVAAARLADESVSIAAVATLRSFGLLRLCGSAAALLRLRLSLSATEEPLQPIFGSAVATESPCTSRGAIMLLVEAATEELLSLPTWPLGQELLDEALRQAAADGRQDEGLCRLLLKAALDAFSRGHVWPSTAARLLQGLASERSRSRQRESEVDRRSASGKRCKRDSSDLVDGPLSSCLLRPLLCMLSCGSPAPSESEEVCALVPLLCELRRELHEASSAPRQISAVISNAWGCEDVFESFHGECVGTGLQLRLPLPSAFPAAQSETEFLFLLCFDPRCALTGGQELTLVTWPVCNREAPISREAPEVRVVFSEGGQFPERLALRGRSLELRLSGSTSTSEPGFGISVRIRSRPMSFCRVATGVEELPHQGNLENACRSSGSSCHSPGKHSTFNTDPLSLLCDVALAQVATELILVGSGKTASQTSDGLSSSLTPMVPQLCPQLSSQLPLLLIASQKPLSPAMALAADALKLKPTVLDLLNHKFEDLPQLAFELRGPSPLGKELFSRLHEVLPPGRRAAPLEVLLERQLAPAAFTCLVLCCGQQQATEQLLAECTEEPLNANSSLAEGFQARHVALSPPPALVAVWAAAQALHRLAHQKAQQSPTSSKTPLLDAAEKLRRVLPCFALGLLAKKEKSEEHSEKGEISSDLDAASRFLPRDVQDARSRPQEPTDGKVLSRQPISSRLLRRIALRQTQASGSSTGSSNIFTGSQFDASEFGVVGAPPGLKEAVKILSTLILDFGVSPCELEAFAAEERDHAIAELLGMEVLCLLLQPLEGNTSESESLMPSDTLRCSPVVLIHCRSALESLPSRLSIASLRLPDHWRAAFLGCTQRAWELGLRCDFGCAGPLLLPALTGAGGAGAAKAAEAAFKSTVTLENLWLQSQEDSLEGELALLILMAGLIDDDTAEMSPRTWEAELLPHLSKGLSQGLPSSGSRDARNSTAVSVPVNALSVDWSAHHSWAMLAFGDRADHSTSDKSGEGVPNLTAQAQGQGSAQGSSPWDESRTSPEPKSLCGLRPRMKSLAHCFAQALASVAGNSTAVQQLLLCAQALHHLPDIDKDQLSCEGIADSIAALEGLLPAQVLALADLKSGSAQPEQLAYALASSLSCREAAVEAEACLRRQLSGGTGIRPACLVAFELLGCASLRSPSRAVISALAELLLGMPRAPAVVERRLPDIVPGKRRQDPSPEGCGLPALLAAAALDRIQASESGAFFSAESADASFGSPALGLPGAGAGVGPPGAGAWAEELASRAPMLLKRLGALEASIFCAQRPQIRPKRSATCPKDENGVQESSEEASETTKKLLEPEEPQDKQEQEEEEEHGHTTKQHHLDSDLGVGSLALSSALVRLLRHPAAEPALLAALATAEEVEVEEGGLEANGLEDHGLENMCHRSRSTCALAALTVISSATDRVAALCQVVTADSQGHGVVLSVDASAGVLTVLSLAGSEDAVFKISIDRILPKPSLAVQWSPKLHAAVARLAAHECDQRAPSWKEGVYSERWLGAVTALAVAKPATDAVQAPACHTALNDEVLNAPVLKTLADILANGMLLLPEQAVIRTGSHDSIRSSVMGDTAALPAEVDTAKTQSNLELLAGWQRIFGGSRHDSTLGSASAWLASQSAGTVDVMCSAGHKLMADLQVHNTCDFCSKHRTNYRCARCDFDLCTRCWEERCRDETRPDLSLAILGRHRSSIRSDTALPEMVVSRRLPGGQSGSSSDARLVRQLRAGACLAHRHLHSRSDVKAVALDVRANHAALLTPAVSACAELPQGLLVMSADGSNGRHGLQDASSIDAEHKGKSTMAGISFSASNSASDFDRELLAGKCESALQAVLGVTQTAERNPVISAATLFEEVWVEPRQREAVLRKAVFWESEGRTWLKEALSTSPSAREAAWALCSEDLLSLLLDPPAVEGEDSIEVETQHNYKSHQNAVFKVTCRDARRLRLSFDRCCDTDSQDTLAVYGDAKLSRRLALCAGKGPDFGDVVNVEGDTAWFVWRSDRRHVHGRADRDGSGISGNWGWRMVVDVVKRKEPPTAASCAQHSLDGVLRLLPLLHPYASSVMLHSLASLLLSVACTDGCSSANTCLRAIRCLGHLQWSPAAWGLLRSLGEAASAARNSPVLAAVVALQLSSELKFRVPESRTPHVLPEIAKPILKLVPSIPNMMIANGSCGAILGGSNTLVSGVCGPGEALATTDPLELPLAVMVCLEACTPLRGCEAYLGLSEPGSEPFWWQQLNSSEPLLLPGGSLLLHVLTPADSKAAMQDRRHAVAWLSCLGKGSVSDSGLKSSLPYWPVEIPLPSEVASKGRLCIVVRVSGGAAVTLMPSALDVRSAPVAAACSLVEAGLLLLPETGPPRRKSPEALPVGTGVLAADAVVSDEIDSSTPTALLSGSAGSEGSRNPTRSQGLDSLHAGARKSPMPKTSAGLQLPPALVAKAWMRWLADQGQSMLAAEANEWLAHDIRWEWLGSLQNVYPLVRMPSIKHCVRLGTGCGLELRFGDDCQLPADLGVRLTADAAGLQSLPEVEALLAEHGLAAGAPIPSDVLCGQMLSLEGDTVWLHSPSIGLCSWSAPALACNLCCGTVSSSASIPAMSTTAATASTTLDSLRPGLWRCVPQSSPGVAPSWWITLRLSPSGAVSVVETSLGRLSAQECRPREPAEETAHLEGSRQGQQQQQRQQPHPEQQPQPQPQQQYGRRHRAERYRQEQELPLQRRHRLLQQRQLLALGGGFLRDPRDLESALPVPSEAGALPPELSRLPLAVSPEALQGWEPAVGEQVVLSSSYEREADGAGGPLSPGEAGQVVAYNAQDRLPVQVQSSGGNTWWYTLKAVVPMSSLQQVPGSSGFRWSSVSGRWSQDWLRLRLHGEDGNGEMSLVVDTSLQSMPPRELGSLLECQQGQSKEFATAFRGTMPGLLVECSIQSFRRCSGLGRYFAGMLIPCLAQDDQSNVAAGHTPPSLEPVTEIIARPDRRTQTLRLEFLATDGQHVSTATIPLSVGSALPATVLAGQCRQGAQQSNMAPFVLLLGINEWVSDITPTLDFVCKKGLNGIATASAAEEAEVCGALPQEGQAGNQEALASGTVAAQAEKQGEESARASQAFKLCRRPRGLVSSLPTPPPVAGLPPGVWQGTARGCLAPEHSARLYTWDVVWVQSGGFEADGTQSSASVSGYLARAGLQDSSAAAVHLQHRADSYLESHLLRRPPLQHTPAAADDSVIHGGCDMGRKPLLVVRAQDPSSGRVFAELLGGSVGWGGGAAKLQLSGTLLTLRDGRLRLALSSSSSSLSSSLGSSMPSSSAWLEIRLCSSAQVPPRRGHHTAADGPLLLHRPTSCMARGYFDLLAANFAWRPQPLTCDANTTAQRSEGASNCFEHQQQQHIDTTSNMAPDNGHLLATSTQSTRSIRPVLQPDSTPATLSPDATTGGLRDKLMGTSVVQGTGVMVESLHGLMFLGLKKKDSEGRRGASFVPAWFVAANSPTQLNESDPDEQVESLPCIWPPPMLQWPGTGLAIAWRSDGAIVCDDTPVAAPATSRAFRGGDCLSLLLSAGELLLLRNGILVGRYTPHGIAILPPLVVGLRGPCQLRLLEELPQLQPPVLELLKQCFTCDEVVGAGTFCDPATCVSVTVRPKCLTDDQFSKLDAPPLEGFRRLLEFPSRDCLQSHLESFASLASQAAVDLAAASSSPLPPLTDEALLRHFPEGLRSSSASAKLRALLLQGLGSSSSLAQAQQPPPPPLRKQHWCGKERRAQAHASGSGDHGKNDTGQETSNTDDCPASGSDRHTHFVSITGSSGSASSSGQPLWRKCQGVRGGGGAEGARGCPKGQLLSLLADFTLRIGIRPVGGATALEALVEAAADKAAAVDADADACQNPHLSRGPSSSDGWLPSLAAASAVAELLAPYANSPRLDEIFVAALRESLAAKSALLHEIGETVLPLLPALVAQSWPVAADEMSPPWGDSLACMKRLLLPGLTKKRFYEVLRETENRPSHQRLSLNSIGARRFQDRRDRRCDRDGRHTLFGQLWHKARSWSPEHFRLPRGDFAFSVDFEGEGGEDAGGLYRAALDIAIGEVQSGFLPLMSPTPNARDNSGDYRDSWIISPCASGSPKSLRMLRFLGALLGLALRTGSLLPLNWPPHLWRPLVGDRRTLEDIRAVDVHTYHVICSLHEDAKLASCLDWVYPDVLGRPQPLRHGRSGSVEPEDAAEFAEALAQSRLSYDAVALTALCAGLALVVPPELLRLWTWQELQRAICGEPHLDVDALRAHTVYTNCQDGDALVAMFWAALESFSEAERERFLRFVWGRTRLPTGHVWEQKFQLAAVAADDERLPTSHTCFFQLDLPCYSCQEVLAERLRFAVNSCITIDSDGQPRTMANWDESAFSDDEGQG